MKEATGILILLIASLASAQQPNPPYLREFPSVEQVLKAETTSDPKKTALLQLQAFYELQEIIKTLAGPREYSGLTPDENRWIQTYKQVGAHLAEESDKAFPGPYGNWKRFSLNVAMYPRNYPDFAVETQLFKRFFSPAVRAAFEKELGIDAARHQAFVEAEQRAYAAANARASGGDANANAGASSGNSADKPEPCPVVETKKVRPAGNSSLTVRGAGYVYTYTETNRQTGAVTNSFTEHGNFINTTLYLLDEDAEAALHSAGIGAGLMGNTLFTFSLMDAGGQVKDMPGMSMLSALSSAMGQGDMPKEFANMAQSDYECGMKAIHLHTVAQITTDGNAVGTFTNVPAGAYYLYGRFYRITSPVRGGGMVWNFKVQVKPGFNTLRLTVDDAALK